MPTGRQSERRSSASTGAVSGRLPRHWKKNIGKLVKVELIDGTQVEGRITEVHGEKISLEDSQIDIKNIKKATLQIEFKK